MQPCWWLSAPTRAAAENRFLPRSSQTLYHGCEYFHLQFPQASFGTGNIEWKWPYPNWRVHFMVLNGVTEGWTRLRKSKLSNRSVWRSPLWTRFRPRLKSNEQNLYSEQDRHKLILNTKVFQFIWHIVLYTTIAARVLTKHECKCTHLVLVGWFDAFHVVSCLFSEISRSLCFLAISTDCFFPILVSQTAWITP